LLGQQQQGAATVGGIVGDGHGGAVLQVLQVLDLFGVGAEGLDVHLAVGHLHQAGLAVLVVAVQVGLVLEEVGVQLLVFHGGVGLHVVAEFLDLQLDAVGFELGLDEVQDFRVGHGGGGHLEHIGSLGGEGQGGNRHGSQGLLQHMEDSVQMTVECGVVSALCAADAASGCGGKCNLGTAAC